MKITVVWSSPNTDGLTAQAKNQFVAGLQKAGADVEEVHLNKLNMQHCMACGDGWGLCKEAGQCVMQDDFADLYRKLVDSDGIAFVTAVYWHDLTEAMKAFIDRLRRCETAHNHFLAQKRCMLIACAGGTGRGPLQCLMNLEDSLQHMQMRTYDRIAVIRYNKDYVLPMIEKAGETYVERLENGFDMYF